MNKIKIKTKFEIFYVIVEVKAAQIKINSEQTGI